MALFKKTAEVAIAKRFSWHKRRTEKPEEFDLFNKFLISSHRSLDVIAEENKIQRSHLDSLVKKHDWMERVSAYEFHHLNKETGLDVEVMLSKEATVHDMNKKHAVIANKAQYVAALGFALLENYIKEENFETDDGKPKKPPFSAEDVVKLARFGVELERTVHGQASKITENVVDYSKLTDEELVVLQQLSDKAGNDSDE